MKIVILDGYTENPGDLSWAGFEAFGDATVYDRTPADQIIPRIGDAEVVYTNKTPITAETLSACKGVKFIGVLATGFNVVDVNAARARGIPVSNIPTYGTTAVAQMVFALLLELCHHVGAHSKAVFEGRWSSCPDFCFWDYPLMELSGKTMGIIGYGRIGRATAAIARAFGMDVVAYDTQVKADEIVPLDELLRRSDVISLHCPLFPETQGIIGRANLAKCKRGALLINTSRGPLVVEEDLKEALESGQLAGAAVDVVSTEPIRPDNVLLKAPNLIITPHIAWAPKESRQRLMDIAVDNLRSYAKGAPINVVNP
jgi:glycerate dehydrogenase